jgi:dTDP-4-amino-4,6-dideoxygalactose transaminase
MRLYRNQGMEKQYDNEVVGFNTRMTDVHAAIGRVQLTKVGCLDRPAAGERGIPLGQPRAEW